MKTSVAILSFVLFVFPASTNAQVVRFGAQFSMPFSLENWSGLSPSTSFDLNTVFPITEGGWGLFASVGTNTGLEKFQTNPQVVTGLTHPVGDTGWSFALTGMYRFILPTDEKEGNHILGMALVPSHPLANGDIVLAFPVGPAYNIGMDSWSFAFSAKISFTIFGL